jgi:chromosome segregation ATPase
MAYPHKARWAIYAAGICWALTANAEAPKQDAAIQQVLRKAQGTLRQLAQEKAQLEADNAALQKDKTAMKEQVTKLQALVKQLEPLQGELEKQKAAAEAAKTANAQLETQLNTGREREQGLHGKLQEIVAQAKKIQGDNLLLVEAVKEREQWMEQCQQKNAAMLDTNQELVKQYQNKGFWEKLSSVEPLTGIGKVKQENAAQEYRFKLQDLQATPFQSKLPQAQPAKTETPQDNSGE